MEKQYSEIFTVLNQLSDRLDAISEEVQEIKKVQHRESTRHDIFYHRIISLEASLDHKLGVFGERIREDAGGERQNNDISGHIG